ncbi:MAG: hypothetical protein RR981_07950, partial [Oscillospiraceae bacterium]
AHFALKRGYFCTNARKMRELYENASPVTTPLCGTGKKLKCENFAENHKTGSPTAEIWKWRLLL